LINIKYFRRSMPLSPEKLMQYQCFSDYAFDNHFLDLFMPNGWFGDRIILKVDENSVTHIGDIKLSGTHSIIHGDPYKIAQAICIKLRGIDISSNDIRVEGKTWTALRRVAYFWSWNHYQGWLQHQAPFDIWVNNELLCVQSMILNVKTTLKTNLPQNLLRKKFYRLYNPKALYNLGVFRISDEKNANRAGVYSNSIWWDVPNDVKLIYKEFGWTNFIKSRKAFHLPFVSLPFTLPSQYSRFIAFDWEDFLPNPKKRRELFHLVKKMDIKALDTYFMKQRLGLRKWNSHNPSCPLLIKKIKDWENRWLKLKAVTSHQPNSVLGHILLEEDETVVKFTLQYFEISARTINKLKVGIYTTNHVVESLARVGRFSLVSRLVAGRLELFGKVPFHSQSFKRVWSVAFAAIEINDANSLRTAIALDQGSNQLHIRGYRGITALGLAVMNDRAELVQLLLNASAMVDQPSWGDETALGLALQLGVSCEVIEELIKAGAKVNGNDLTGNNIKDSLKSRGIIDNVVLS